MVTATSANTPKTILLRGKSQTMEEAPLASTAIKPGHLIERTSTGAVQPHSTAAGKHGKLFAVENELIGLGIDDSYSTAAEEVYFAACSTGTVVYALLEASHTIAIGDYLESNGDGTLQPVSGNFPVAVALDAITSIASIVRIRVEVL